MKTLNAKKVLEKNKSINKIKILMEVLIISSHLISMILIKLKIIVIGCRKN